MMALGPQGTVFVGSQFAGKVYAVVDRDGDHKADQVLTIASGLTSAQWRRHAQRRAVCGDHEPDSPVRRHRKAPRRAAEAGHRPRQSPESEPGSHVEVHRVRTRRHAVHVGRFDVQHLRAGGDDRRDPADEAGRDRTRDLRRGHPEQRRLRVAPGDTRTVVHRQRPRHDGRRRAERRAQCRVQGGPALRLPVLPSGRRPGSRVRRTARLLDDRAAGAEARRARGGDRLHVLHRQHVSRALQERGDHRRARVVEPLDAERLSRHGGVHRRTQGHWL